MKNIKKTLLTATAATLLIALAGCTASAAPAANVQVANETDKSVSILPVNPDGPIQAQPKDVTNLPADINDDALPALPAYGSFTGTVTEVAPYYGADGKTPVEGKVIVSVEDKDGMQADFIVSQDTPRLTDTKPQAGEAFTGWYDAARPMIMIYPPRYTPDVIQVGALAEGQNVKVDRFDEGLLASEGSLKLNVGKDTEVVNPDGTAFEGNIAERNLAVVYGPTTRSIPAQTTPIRVIVLEEKK